MTKIYEVECCYDCPLSKITKLYENTLICKHYDVKNRIIDIDDIFKEIPSWCPLENK